MVFAFSTGLIHRRPGVAVAEAPLGPWTFVKEIIRVWKFLLDENSWHVDMYLRNLDSTGAFFFRDIDSEGNYQSVQMYVYGSFKGSYEIGYSFWTLALNKDLAV